MPDRGTRTGLRDPNSDLVGFEYVPSNQEHAALRVMGTWHINPSYVECERLVNGVATGTTEIRPVAVVRNVKALEGK